VAVDSRIGEDGKMCEDVGREFFTWIVYVGLGLISGFGLGVWSEDAEVY
jgi:hypothetical protein